jgi:DNA-binding response OmpR family regulator
MAQLISRAYDTTVAMVLIIEFEPHELRLMGWALLEAGFEVASASSIDGAVERTERLRPEVIVFNTSVPPEAKARCIQVLRAINAASRVINVYAPVSGQGPDIPADAYLEKPFGAQELVGTIRKLLAQRSEAS